MNTKQTFLFLLSALLFAACAGDNVEDKYGGGGEFPPGMMAHFPLNGDLSNRAEGSAVQLSYNGAATPEFASGAGVRQSKALKLNGENEYLTISLDETYDTLSVIFWVKMDNEFFRSKNPKPVWIDYGMGAVRVAVDGITESTKLLVTGNAASQSPASQLVPSGEWDNMCTWSLNTLFYMEIVKEKITGKIKAKHVEYPEKYFDLSIDMSQSPLDIKENRLYIGRPSGAGSYSGEYLQGTINNICIYNRGLTQSDINVFTHIPLD